MRPDKQPLLAHDSRPASVLDESGMPARKPSVRTRIIGIALLLCVVLMWTGSNFITSAIETSTDSYNKPFALTFISTSFFVLYLIKPLAKALYRVIVKHDAFYLMETPLLHSDREARQALLSNEPVSPLNSFIALRTDTQKLGEGETFKLAAFFVVIWFGANFSVNAALSLTSVSSVTILATTSGFFTLLLGHMLGFGHFSLLKLFAVVSSLAGVVLICTKDNDMASSTAASNTGARLLGDAFSLLSALLYASYVSLLKVTVKDESKLNTSLFFGFVGAINVVGMWPFGLALHYAGLERLEWPSSREIVAGLILNGFITFISDYIYVIAMLKTSPLVVTLGLSLTIPCAILGDVFEGTPLGGWKTGVGAFLVVLGFIVVGVTDQADEVPALSDADSII